MKRKTTYTARATLIAGDGTAVDVTVYSSYKTTKEAQDGIERLAKKYKVICSEIVKNS